MTRCDLGKKRIHSNDELFASHIRAWTSLWSRGRVDIFGDISLARAAYSSWYYILSSLPVNYHPQFVGLSPCGLPLSDEQVTWSWFDVCVTACHREMCVSVYKWYVNVLCDFQISLWVPMHTSKSLKVRDFFLLNSMPWQYFKTGQVLESAWIHQVKLWDISNFLKQVFCLKQELLIFVMFCFYQLKLSHKHRNRY